MHFFYLYNYKLAYFYFYNNNTIKNILSKPIVGYGTCRGQLMLINSVQIHGRNILYFSHNYLLENMIQGGILVTLALGLVYFITYKKSSECKGTILYSMISCAIFSVLFMGQSGCVLFHPTVHFEIVLLYYCKKIIETYKA